MVIVNKIEQVPGYDLVFKLSNSKTNSDYIHLDCQSYFHKFELFNSQNQLKSEVFLSGGECEYLWEKSQTCIQEVGSKCIQTEDLFNPDCSCL